MFGMTNLGSKLEQEKFHSRKIAEVLNWRAWEETIPTAKGSPELGANNFHRGYGLGQWSLI